MGPPTADGYHPLQSLVVFADIGDVIEMHAAQGATSTLTIDGPFADGLENDGSNLVLRTAQFLSNEKFDFKLIKNLPVASGIGGGSADAAATARLMSQAGATRELASLVELGADIPVCISSETSLMEGKGERLTPLNNLGQAHAILVNPGVAVSTGEIFRLFDETNPSSSNLEDEYKIGSDFIQIAQAGRNDLQDVATSIAPEILSVLNVINDQENCQLARMSGSGATCFGLFSTKNAARAAHKVISTTHPHWWCVQTTLGDKP